MRECSRAKKPSKSNSIGGSSPGCSSCRNNRAEQHNNIERGKDEQKEVIQLLLSQDDVGVGDVIGEGYQTV